MSFSAPSYLTSHRNGLYFRLRIPSDLRPVMGMQEFKKSLKTRYLREARPKVIRLVTTSHAIFDEFRKRRDDVMSGRLSRETIRRIAQQWLDEALEEEREYRLSRSWELYELDKRNEQLTILATDAQEALECSNLKKIEGRASELLDREEIDVEKDSKEYREFCAALLEVEARFLNAARKTGFVGILQGQEQSQVVQPEVGSLLRTSQRQN